MIFEWDSRKAASNERKHRVSFDEAATSFGDFGSITVPDGEHSVGEKRFFHIGLTHVGRLVAMSFAARGDRIRIISARLATRAERRQYEEG